MKTNILILGAGGREHALAAKLRESSDVATIYIAPGNSGTAMVGQNIQLDPENVSEVRQAVRDRHIGLVIVNSAEALGTGTCDMLRAEEIAVVGPSKAAARLENARAFAKDFMRRHDVPTARYAVFTDFESAVAYSDREAYPLVLKASITSTSGRIVRETSVAQTKSEAFTIIRRALIDRAHEGALEAELIIEEYMEGQEIMVRAFCDGNMWRLFPALSNHRRVHDGDTGALTPGMGSVTPVPFVSQTMLAEIDAAIFVPTVTGLAQESMPFVGCLGATIILTESGPKVVDYSVRFGDPDAETWLGLLETDLFSVLRATTEGRLTECDVRWKKGASASVVVITGGYPGLVETGKIISGLADAEKVEGVHVYHADTYLEKGNIMTSGGRVLVVVACAATLAEAIAHVYEASGKIAFGGMYYRRDIGKQVLSIPLS